MLKVHIYTNIGALYRWSIWKKLLENTSYEFHIFYDPNNEQGIESIDIEKFNEKIRSRLHHFKNFWYENKILLWQHGLLQSVIFDTFDIAIFLGEMYSASTWMAANICKSRNKKVLFWGHGIYGNESKVKLLIRKSFYRLAQQHLLYERRAKQLMIEENFNPESLYVVFNSLDYETHQQLRNKYAKLQKENVFPELYNPNCPIIIFIGRLTKQKKINLLIDAVKQMNRDTVKYNLILVGDGPQKSELYTSVEFGVINRWCVFKEATYDDHLIGKYLSVADLCVSPGNIGLTAIHSLSFGTPICTHDNFNNQMPEAETLIEGKTGIFFKENSSIDLALNIQKWFSQNLKRSEIQKQCYEVIDKYYNPSYQESVFVRALQDLPPEV